MFRTFLYRIVIVALLVGVLGGLAGVEAQSPPFGGCGGFASHKVVLRFQPNLNVPNPLTIITQLDSPGDKAFLAGAELEYNTPAGGELFAVTFSAACRLKGALSGPLPDDDTPTEAVIGDRVEVGIQLDDGVNAPLEMGPGPIPFCSGNRWAMHSSTFCRRVNAGTNTIRVYGRLIDDPQDPQTGNLVGELGPWTLQLLVND
jgi:hypothetical protein